MKYIAIDPGTHFALACITAPTRVITTTDHEEAFEILRKCGEAAIGIEDVHAIYMAGAKSTFNFGRQVGFWEGILGFLGRSHLKLSIKKWQEYATGGVKAPDTKKLDTKARKKVKQLHRDELKMESFRCATLAFPDCRLASHDVADAVNMARYLRHIVEKKISFDESDSI